MVASRLSTGRYGQEGATGLREKVKELLAAADDSARRGGYDPEFVKLATYAVIGFTDEAVLASGLRDLGDWARAPLQQDVFGDALAGVRFYTNLTSLMSHPDSEALADLLEVHQFCLLLGFRGKHGADSDQRRRALVEAIYDRIGRIRGIPELGHAGLPEELGEVRARRDVWIGRLGLAAATLVAAALVVFVVNLLRLGPLVDSLGPLARLGEP